jgi:hypothetical protein
MRRCSGHRLPISTPITAKETPNNVGVGDDSAVEA